MSNLNKNDLVELIANDCNFSKADANKAVSAFVNAVKQSLQKGKRVTLVGFGTFSVTQTKTREGRNPRTGQKITIPGGKKPKFSAGKDLKEAVN